MLILLCYCLHEDWCDITILNLPTQGWKFPSVCRSGLARMACDRPGKPTSRSIGPVKNFHYIILKKHIWLTSYFGCSYLSSMSLEQERKLICFLSFLQKLGDFHQNGLIEANRLQKNGLYPNCTNFNRTNMVAGVHWKQLGCQMTAQWFIRTENVWKS